jgi:hypothetical protein
VIGVICSESPLLRRFDIFIFNRPKARKEFQEAGFSYYVS